LLELTGKTTTYTYNSNGFRTSLKDPLGNMYSAVNNPVGGPTSVTSPLNETQNVAYDPNFNVSTITDALGRVTAFTYNRQAQPLTQVDASQKVNSPFQGYPVMGGVNQRETPTTSSITVNFPASGPYPFELDYAKGGDAKLTLTMQAGGLPIPSAALLVLSPNAPPSLTTSSIQTVNINAIDPTALSSPASP
jgi:YD repeat-containing protein